MSYYFFEKYPYKHYPLVGTDGKFWTMFSLPIEAQIEMYKERLGEYPTSFFDFGCATAEIMTEAYDLGLWVKGIDIEKYPVIPVKNQHLFDNGNVQIKSILEYENVAADLSFANGSFTYLKERDLNNALDKFVNTKMLVAIHITTEDILAAKNKRHCKIKNMENRLIKPKDWWLEKFDSSGFETNFNEKYGCFCAIPKKYMGKIIGKTK